jgi:XTP/dITP diphosphohydrolase/tetrapyrrole methylase family protein/MazG family protein
VKLFKDLPPALCALLRAREVWKTVAKKKLVVDAAAARLDRAEIARRAVGLTEERAGEEIFAWVAACREAGVDPESALRRQTRRVVDASSAAV